MEERESGEASRRRERRRGRRREAGRKGGGEEGRELCREAARELNYGKSGTSVAAARVYGVVYGWTSRNHRCS